MKKDVALNYNMYPAGADPIWRDGQDLNADGTMVESRYPFPSDGGLLMRLEF